MATAEGSTKAPPPKLQAGGGVVQTERQIEAVSETILQYLKASVTGHRPLSGEQLQEYYAKSTSKKPEEAEKKEPSGVDLGTFLDYMTSGSSNAMLEAPQSNLNYPISSYFISSSHNSYLQGNQLWGEASAEVYSNILLRGCRCVEVDVWNGLEVDEGEKSERVQKVKQGLKAYLSRKIGTIRKNSPDRGRRQEAKKQEDSVREASETPSSAAKRSEPRVLHGHTLTKEVSYRQVCEAIRDSAFATSDLPVIVSLEVHADAEQQQIMVDIMEDVWQGLMVQSPPENSACLPSPAELRHKILVKVKAGTRAKQPEQEGQMSRATSNSLSSSENEVDDQLENATSKKKDKKQKTTIIEALSAMGVYTHGYHFKSFTSPEAQVLNHVFSLSEKKLVDVNSQHGPQLFAHNQKFLMRAYPAGTRLDSTNFDPSVYWRLGVQIAALNWQSFDAVYSTKDPLDAGCRVRTLMLADCFRLQGVMINEGEFAGTGGWVLKPQGYRGPLKGHDVSEGVPDKNKKTESVDLSIEILAAQDLPLSKEVSISERLQPYVKCELHIEVSRGKNQSNVQRGKKNTEKLKWRSKNGHGNNPDFKGSWVHFGRAEAIAELSFVRFKIQDDVRGRDDLIAWACIRLDRLKTGLRFVHLLDSSGVSSVGVLLVNIVKHGLASYASSTTKTL